MPSTSLPSSATIVHCSVASSRKGRSVRFGMVCQTPMFGAWLRDYTGTVLIASLADLAHPVNSSRELVAQPAGQRRTSWREARPISNKSSTRHKGSSGVPGGEHRSGDLRLARAKAAYLANRLREDLLGSVIRLDQRWDMLLVLYILDAAGEAPSVTRITELSAGPMTTALRALDRFEAEGLITRHPHNRDRRLVLLQLTDRAREALDEYFTLSDEAAPTQSVFDEI
jgi:DNA-binding MarR family transcriptional regulator